MSYRAKNLTELVEINDKILQDFLDKSQIGLAIIDGDFHFRKVNESFCRITGYPDKELYRLKYDDILYPQYVEKDVVKLRGLIEAKGQVYKMESNYLRKDSSAFNCSVSITTIFNRGGEFLYFLALFEDITEYIRAENALKESERLLKETQAVARLGSFVWNILTGIWTSSDILDEIFGIGQNYDRTFDGWLNIVHPSWRDKMMDYVTNDVLKRHQMFDIEYQIIKLDDRQTRWVHGIGKLEFDSNNNPLILIGTIRDITEHKLTENHLIKTSRILSVLSHINHAIINIHERDPLFEEICDISVRYGEFRLAWIGLVNGDEKFVKPVAWKGMEEGFLTNVNKFSINDTEIYNSPTRLSILEGKTIICNDIANDPMMLKLRDEALNYGYYSSATFPIRAYNKVVGTFTLYADKVGYFNIGEVQLLTDVTANISFAIESINNDLERKQAEEELKNYGVYLEETVERRTSELESAKERAESADRLKSTFLASMSHELRTPLNSVIGFSSILMSERPGPLNEEQKKQLRMIQSSGRYLLSLINDILDLSKIEAGQFSANFESFNVKEVIEDILKTEAPLAESKGITLRSETAPEIENIISDKQRVRQILLNLLNNAIKFTEKGFVGIECYADKKFIKVMVRDTGIGIRKEDLGMLFNPFIQINNELTRKNQGTGLGLSISKKLIELLDGTIEVKSEYGIGSTFIVTLPRKKNNAKNKISQQI